MHIKLNNRYLNELELILDFIADDSVEASLVFHDELYKKLDSIPSMPYRHRKSIKADDENIRDLIYKGYVIPYRIKEDVIEVLGIFSQNTWEL